MFLITCLLSKALSSFNLITPITLMALVHKPHPRQILTWKDAVSATASPQGLQPFRQLLGEEAASDTLGTADQLGYLFKDPSLGSTFTDYARFISTGSEDKAGTSSAAEPLLPDAVAPFKRGLSLVAKGQWTDAYKVFEADQDAKPLQALCR